MVVPLGTTGVNRLTEGINKQWKVCLFSPFIPNVKGGLLNILLFSKTSK